MIPPTGPFPREARIRQAREFREIADAGRRQSSTAFVLIVTPTRGNARARLGITASRKVGDAVVRNRVKRRIREWFRRGGQEQLTGLDALIIARTAAAQLGGSATIAALDRVAKGIR